MVLTSAPCFRLNGRVSESRTRAATLAASSGRSSGDSTSTNSSPPSRASVVPAAQLGRAQQDVGLADAGADALGHPLEQHVAGVVAEACR